jgi:pimeloyl-ACP methyl ester carboxylesterase
MNKLIKRIDYGVEWVYAGSSGPKAIVFAPPLIGGHALQQIRLLRPLLRRQQDLFSFSYAGHGESVRKFSLRAALQNCSRMLDLALGLGTEKHIPLFGLASCFGALPLLHAARRLGEPFEKVVLINAVARWWPGKLAGSFLRHWYRHGDRFPRPAGLPKAFQSYLEDLLPGLLSNTNAFGTLNRQRIDMGQIVREFLHPERDDRPSLANTPVLCIYGRRDRLPGHLGFANWFEYEAYILQLCPQAEFHPVDSDHFLSGPDTRKSIYSEISKFFECRRDR